jgi:hypothetical protein
LTCYFARRKISAYLDGALGELASRTTAGHLRSCARCQEEADGLRKVRSLLQSVASPAEPDWTGFWQGIVRGIEDRGHAKPAIQAPARRWRWTPALAVSGGLAAAALAAVLVASPWTWYGAAPEVAFTTVNSANTEYPGGTMVYASPDREVNVVWVFDEE